MKKIFLFIFIISFLSLITFESIEASNQRQRALLLQQIEILQQEIRLLQALIFNFRLRQEITADSYLAIDLSDNSIILAKNANQPYPIASITKLMSAVVALENIDLNQIIILTRKMLRPSGRSPSLFLGARVSIKNLLKASLIQSSNDAAEAKARFIGKEKFVDLMNQKAKDLGMSNTRFYDASGLNPSNRSTVADLAKLVGYIHQKYPEIWEITRNNNFWLPDATGKLLKFRNLNSFYPLNQFIGGKTDRLPEARQTFASVFRVNERPIAIILLYSDNHQADTFTIFRQL
jgi:D-alanyl-D-alanine carboxypeptidase